MRLKVKRLTQDAILPTYATDGSACFDIYSSSEGEVYKSHIFDTGLSFEIPEGYVMLVFSRSGHGFKNDIRLANCVGVIDSDYRGELKVKLTNDYGIEKGSEMWWGFAKGDRIAQAMLIPYPKVEFVEVGELSETDRGQGGFGSSGK